MAAGETSCVNCIHGGVACVFAPRSKCGRPKGTSSSKAKASRQAEDQEATDGGQRQQPSPEYNNQGADKNSMDMPDFDPLDGDFSAYMCWNTMDDLPPPHQDMGTCGYGDMRPLSLPTSPSISFASSSFPNLAAFPLTPPLSMGPSPMSPCSDNDDLGFDSALDICRRLDECCRQIGGWAFLPSNNHEMFDLASRLCSATTTRGHCPAAALIMAGVLKGVELCGLIVARLSHPTPLACSPSAADQTGHFFLLQRIDLLLLQSKVFLVRAGQAAGAQKAVELHQHIESTLARDFAGWTW